MTGVDTVFAGCAILGGVLFFMRLVLFFVGHHGGAEDVGGDFDGDVGADFDVGGDFDGDVDAADAIDAHADSDVSFKMLSLQTITAFFMMFGLVGLALRKEAELVEAWAILGAMIAGLFSVWVISKIMTFMMGLQSSGTMRLANAIGQEGSVYLRIPADGVGKVQVVVHDHLKVFDAVSKKGQEFQTGERVTVVSIAADNKLVVDKG